MDLLSDLTCSLILLSRQARRPPDGAEVLGESGKAGRHQGTPNEGLRHTWKTNAQRSGIDPAVRNAIAGHASVRPVEDRYIRISDEVLLEAVDSMTFDHGCTELDFVEEPQTEESPEKGMDGVWKMLEKKKKVA